MRPVIRPGFDVYRRDPRHLQFGTSADDSLVLEDRPGLVDLLRLLDGHRDLATVALLAADGVPALDDPPDGLIAALQDAGIVVDAEPWDASEPALDTEARSLTAAGIAAPEAQDRLVRRSQSCVEVRVDPTAAELADSAVACVRDLGIDVARAPERLATLVLVVSCGPTDRAMYAAFRHERTPHLVAAVDGARIHVGPLVHPRATPCVECSDRQRAEWDPCWSAVAAQLGSPLARPAATYALAAATRIAGAAVIAHEIAAFCDEVEPLTASRTLTIGPGVHDREESTVAFHPECGCRG
ncbi:hypothetical protein [Solicola gregarius]|uniref:Bacteriocin biosynthesis cyclodehydratase domain-containing protein n=1 Tax=Solicola gregarius TaxID=2908642 RepID=A0AA46TIU1_9ACTN|nr:hypothetical protein [Solicola gregarius]UYM06091.1 hypothetical protein L0C25_03185 [Solicola gregarius]